MMFVVVVVAVLLGVVNAQVPYEDFDFAIAPPYSGTLSIPSNCDIVRFITVCGGSGGHFGPNSWGDSAGGRGACLTLTGGSTALTAMVATANYVVVGTSGSNVQCGGGTHGAGGGGLSGLFSLDKVSTLSPLIVAAGGGGASRSALICDAAFANAASHPISGAQPIPSVASDCALFNADGAYFGIGGRESDPMAMRGINGSGYSSWAGGQLTQGGCLSAGGFGGGGSGGHTSSGFGCGGGGAGYPGGGLCAITRQPGPSGLSFVAPSTQLNVALSFNTASNGTTQRGGDGSIVIRCSGPPTTTTTTTMATTTTTTARPSTPRPTTTTRTTSTQSSTLASTTTTLSSQSSTVSGSMSESGAQPIVSSVVEPSTSSGSDGSGSDTSTLASAETTTTTTTTTVVASASGVENDSLINNVLYVPLIAVSALLCIAIVAIAVIVTVCMLRRSSTVNVAPLEDSSLRQANTALYAGMANSSYDSARNNNNQPPNYGPLGTQSSTDYSALEIGQPSQSQYSTFELGH